MDLIAYYSLITTIVSCISIIGLIILLVIKIIKKQKFTFINYVFLVIFLIGIYLYVPYYFYKSYFSTGYVKFIQKALKFSINPIERTLCHSTLASYYFIQKEGNKAIENLQKATKYRFIQSPSDVKMLMYLYSLKGEREKTFETAKKLKASKSISLVNIYLMDNDYEKALESLPDYKSEELFLRADLYKILGDKKNYDLTYKEAKSVYNSKLNAQTSEAKRIETQKCLERYKNIDSYKIWLIKMRNEFKF